MGQSVRVNLQETVDRGCDSPFFCVHADVLAACFYVPDSLFLPTVHKNYPQACIFVENKPFVLFMQDLGCVEKQDNFFKKQLWIMWIKWITT
ncbi:hypothetical protein DUZ99_02365 [Xylanibacillus composti]|nr:hypothetical protein [Xylanibacillus composti]